MCKMLTRFLFYNENSKATFHNNLPRAMYVSNKLVGLSKVTTFNKQPKHRAVNENYKGSTEIHLRNMRRGHIYQRLYENTEYNIRARYSQQNHV